MKDKSHLIVTGVARSGTTALAELLNSHPEVCIGIERFKFRYLLQHDYSVSLYDHDRFFDFQKEDTNLRPEARPAWQPVYDEMARKWNDAVVVGDKVPDLTPFLGDFLAAQPDTRCLFILRNLKDVARSWHARANRKRDSWPTGKNFAAACHSWAEQQRQLLDLWQSRPELRTRILLLDYDRMYAEDAPTEARLLDFLGLPFATSFSETFAAHCAFAAARKSTKVPADFTEIYKSIDMGPWKRLRRISLKQMNGPAGADDTQPSSAPDEN